jgi:hypothetical protein
MSSNVDLKELIGKFEVSRGDTPWSPSMIYHIVGYYKELVLDEDRVEVYPDESKGILVAVVYSSISENSAMFMTTDRQHLDEVQYDYNSLTDSELELVDRISGSVQRSRIENMLVEGLDKEFSIIDRKACARYKKIPSREKIKAQLESLMSRKEELYYMIDGFYEP